MTLIASQHASGRRICLCLMWVLNDVWVHLHSPGSSGSGCAWLPSESTAFPGLAKVQGVLIDDSHWWKTTDCPNRKYYSAMCGGV